MQYIRKIKKSVNEISYLINNENNPLPFFTAHLKIDINECLSQPCLNGATCIDQVNNYSCSCQAGYQGRNCQTDIDECLGQPCLNSATCIDQVNDYNCFCQTGYRGRNCHTGLSIGC
ncbi:coagulation factor IX-like [Porites lutea]|uniref:coagulation factor IX-like n=1 Tax=Porites lutea TaxID=51062 RepID=UPI003CC56177